jgi:hypothetical protein
VNEYVTKFTQLSHYAPNEMDTDEKKQDCFLNGLNDEFAYALEARDWPLPDAASDLWLPHPRGRPTNAGPHPLVGCRPVGSTTPPDFTDVATRYCLRPALPPLLVSSLPRLALSPPGAAFDLQPSRQRRHPNEVGPCPQGGCRPVGSAALAPAHCHEALLSKSPGLDASAPAFDAGPRPPTPAPDHRRRPTPVKVFFQICIKFECNFNEN